MQKDNYTIDYFQKLNMDETIQAERLADKILEIYAPISSLVDIGCATGLYIRPFLAKGVEAYGVDSAEEAKDPSVVQVDPERIETEDIRSFYNPEPEELLDIALCIETLEHIPAADADKAVRNIASFSDTLIISAAKPGQAGDHHHNCQPKEYWEEKFSKHGFTRDLETEQDIINYMLGGYHTNWIDNLMVLQR